MPWYRIRERYRRCLHHTQAMSAATRTNRFCYFDHGTVIIAVCVRWFRTAACAHNAKHMCWATNVFYTLSCQRRLMDFKLFHALYTCSLRSAPLLELDVSMANAQSMSWQRFRIFSMSHPVGGVAHIRTHPSSSMRRTHSCGVEPAA